MKQDFLILAGNFAILMEFVSAIVGTFYYSKYKDSPLKFLIFLLWYISINDLLGTYLADSGIVRHNAILYNIYHIINFTILFLIYRNFLKNKKVKLLINLFILIYISSFIINGVFENYLIKFQTIPYIIAASFMIITITFYFIELLNSIKVLNTNKNLLFWISVGLLIFFVGNIPFRIVRNYYADLADISILFLINIILTIVLNICFIIGFIWSDRKQLY